MFRPRIAIGMILTCLVLSQFATALLAKDVPAREKYHMDMISKNPKSEGFLWSYAHWLYLERFPYFRDFPNDAPLRRS